MPEVDNSNNETGTSPKLGVPDAVFEEFRKSVQADMEPYVKHAKEGFNRTFKLLELATNYRPTAADVLAGKPTAAAQLTSDDIFRAVVVLTHAYLEELLRTLGRTFLPIATESVLNNIPFVGSTDGSRIEKFSLGKLAQHKGKSVNDVIRESIDEYLARKTFNSVKEVSSFLIQIGVRTTSEEHLPALDAMIHRRHLIVHCADRVAGVIPEAK